MHRFVAYANDIHGIRRDWKSFKFEQHAHGVATIYVVVRSQHVGSFNVMVGSLRPK